MTSQFSRPARDMLELICGRRSVSPKRLTAPAPSVVERDMLMRAAVAAPDHGGLRPWRLMVFDHGRRDALADLFEAALIEHRPQAGDEDRVRAREKASRGPLLLGLIARYLRDHPVVTVEEQTVAAGAALQNILLAAEVMGYGARATSGRTVHTRVFRQGVGLAPGENFICFISIGTPGRRSPAPQRPAPEDILSHWHDPA